MFTAFPQIPGIHLDEVFPKPAPILLTGVPVFLGFTREYFPPQPIPQKKDRLGEEVPPIPLKLTLWTQFQTYFGDPAEGYLGPAVRGFFENGGEVCYVLRIKDKDTNSLKKSLEILDPYDEIDLICAPDLAGDLALQQLILGNCDRSGSPNSEMGNRFAILDGPNIDSPAQLDQVLEYRKSLKGTNGALYYPWIQTQHSWLTKEGNRLSAVPPCGHIAGIYARCDRTIGVHKAPANEVMEDVQSLSISLTTADLSKLNLDGAGAGVNCLRTVPGRGTRIWGVRTVSADPNWSYISVRRLILTVGRWVALKLADVTFEPNSFNLWIRIERELNAYLESLAQQGALQGNVPQEAFYVKCDAETNPPEVRDTGQIVTEIGLAPTRPNEFIVVRLIHGDTGVTLT